MLTSAIVFLFFVGEEKAPRDYFPVLCFYSLYKSLSEQNTKQYFFLFSCLYHRCVWYTLLLIFVLFCTQTISRHSKTIRGNNMLQNVPVTSYRWRGSAGSLLWCKQWRQRQTVCAYEGRTEKKGVGKEKENKTHDDIGENNKRKRTSRTNRKRDWRERRREEEGKGKGRQRKVKR